MKKFVFFCACLIGLQFCGFAQTFDWAISIGGTGYEQGNSMVRDGDGNIYITGIFTSISDFDPSLNVANLEPMLDGSGNGNIFIAKYDSLGNYLWAKNIGNSGIDKGYNITIDSFSNIYITGFFRSTVDFDPGPGVANLTSNGSFDVFIARYDSDGNYVWAVSVGGSNDDYGNSMVIDNSNNICIIGKFKGTVDFDPGPGVANLTSNGSFDVFIAKYDSDGNYVWAVNIGGTSWDYGNDIVIDYLNNIYVSGYFMSTVDFDPGPGVNIHTSPSGKCGFFVAKYDSLGNHVWAHYLADFDSQAESYPDYGNSIAIGDSSIHAVGFLKGTFDFDPGPGVANLSSGGTITDIFVAKYDLNGLYVWAKNIGTGYCYFTDVAVDNLNNVYFKSKFSGTFGVDFDPGPGTAILTGNSSFIARYDSDGNYVWAKDINIQRINGSNTLLVDDSYNLFLTGYFTSSTVDFDPGPGVVNLNHNGLNDIFVLKLNQKSVTQGTVYNDFNQNCTQNIGEPGIEGWTLIINPGNYVVQTDSLGAYTLDSLPMGNYTATIDTTNHLWLSTCPTTQSFSVIHHNVLTEAPKFGLIYNQATVQGTVYNDFNQNCTQNIGEPGIEGWTLIINPGNYVVQTDSLGAYTLDSLPMGNYTATIDTTNHLWLSTCPTTQSFSVTNPIIITQAPEFGLVNLQPCTNPLISIYAPILRVGFSNQQIYVTACNGIAGTVDLDTAYAQIQLPLLISLQSATLPYTDLGNNLYQFNLGNLSPGQCVSWTISATVSWSAVLWQTLCMEATLYPIQSCIFDSVPSLPPGPGITPCTLPWDKSSLSVDGWCQNDSVYFTITNTGDPIDGDMECWAPVRIYIDGVLTELDSIQLQGGENIIYVFAGNGWTWRLEVDQHPLHPGNSHPNAVVEFCGDSLNWNPGGYTSQYEDDADPVVDVYCGIVTGSFDPNDKIGYPTGVGVDHYIYPNQQLQYMIRFQNTGNDTAFTVVIRDTLDMNLNIFTVTPGVTSHSSTFRMYGPRVLEWTFENIMLPDSNVNEPASHGFVTFTVQQNPNMPFGTQIRNEAGIYFDFNEPVITNQTVHTLYDFSVVLTALQPIESLDEYITIYPNPTSSNVTVEFPILQENAELMLMNMLGEIVTVVNVPKGTNSYHMSVEGNTKGLYFMVLNVSNKISVSKIVVN